MRSPRNERFFLYGYYGQGNLGDDLLLRATIEGIRTINPNSSFVVRNEGAVKGIDIYGASVVLTGIDKILSDQSQSKFHRALKTLTSYRRYFRECGWLVLGGGTVFHERNSIAALVLLTSICLLARLTGLRVVVLGIGISKLNSLAGRMLLSAIVRMSDLFAVRDSEALAECAKAGVAQAVEQTGDLVFTLAPIFAGHNVSQQAGTRRRIGVSIYPPAFLDAQNGQAVFDAFQRSLTILINRGWIVSFLIFHDDPEKIKAQQDYGLLARLDASLPLGTESSVSHHALSADPAIIRDVFSEMDLHCGMRFHGHVLSVIFGLPFVGLAVDNKINGICDFFGMPVIEMNEISEANIVNAVDVGMTRSVDKQLRETLRLRAQENFFRFSELYRSRLRQGPCAETNIRS